jgi:glucose/mannose transport system permease protein
MGKDRTLAVLVLLPSILALALFVYGFIGQTVYTSMTDADRNQALANTPPTFVGLKNYVDLFSLPDGTTGDRFRRNLVNTLFFTVGFIAVCLVVGLTLALLLDQKIQGEAIFRTIFLFPMSLSFVVTGVVWKWLFNVNSGLNLIPTAIGLDPGTFRWFDAPERAFGLTFRWVDVPMLLLWIGAGVLVFFTLNHAFAKRSTTAALLGGGALLLGALAAFNIPLQLMTPGANADQMSQALFGLLAREQHGLNVALWALVIAAGWQMCGYTMAMYLAGLRGISDDLREAARVDGANEFQVYWQIILPLLQPITLSAVIILGHISLKIFDLVYTMGGDNPRYIDMPGLNMYLVTFRGGEFAMGAAIGTIMLILVAFAIVPYLVTSLREEKHA